MAIGDDFSVAVNGDIRHTSGTTNYTVLELHRWLQDLADDAAASGNDLIDITSATPSERSTDQIITLNAPYNVDDAAIEFLYGGSITQAGGDTQYSGVAVVGAVFGTTTLQVVQDNALYDTDSPFWGATDETYDTGYNGDSSSNTLMRVMIKSRDAGSDIDGKVIRIYAREWGHTWAEFSVTLGLGEATAAIFTNEDLNNATAVGTVAGWTTISQTSTGYTGIDLGNGNGTKYYLDEWNTNQPTRSINDFYERMKYLGRRGTSETIHGLDGELYRGITHQWAFDAGTGAFTEDEVLTWTGGGEAILLAVDSTGATGNMWVQLTKGSAPGDGVTISGVTSTETADINGSVTTRPISAVFIGQSTGSAIIGAFGIGIESADLTNADKITALDNSLQQPPNNVTFSVEGLVSGQDYVLLTPESGGSIDTTQMTLATTLSGATETAIDVGTGNIPSGIPQTGVLRVVLDDGRHRRVAYTAHNGDDTFTIASSDWTDPDDATAGNGVYQGMIDTLAGSDTETYTQVYPGSAVPVFVRVRDGGGTPIKTFEVTGSIGTGGGSATAIRTSDA